MQTVCLNFSLVAVDLAWGAVPLAYSFASTAGCGHAPHKMKSATVGTLLSSEASACATQKSLGSHFCTRGTQATLQLDYAPASCRPTPGTQHAIVT